MIFHAVTFIKNEDGELYRGIVPIDSDLYTNVEHALSECDGAVSFSIGEMPDLLLCHTVPRFRTRSHYVFVTPDIIRTLTLSRFDALYALLDRSYKQIATTVLYETIRGYIISDPFKRLSSDEDLVPPVIARIQIIQKQLGLSDITMLYIASDILEIEGPTRLDGRYMLLADANKILDYMKCCAN